MNRRLLWLLALAGLALIGIQTAVQLKLHQRLATIEEDQRVARERQLQQPAAQLLSQRVDRIDRRVAGLRRDEDRRQMMLARLDRLEREVGPLPARLGRLEQQVERLQQADAPATRAKPAPRKGRPPPRGRERQADPTSTEPDAAARREEFELIRSRPLFRDLRGWQVPEQAALELVPAIDGWERRLSELQKTDASRLVSLHQQIQHTIVARTGSPEAVKWFAGRYPHLWGPRDYVKRQRGKDDDERPR